MKFRGLALCGREAATWLDHLQCAVLRDRFHLAGSADLHGFLYPRSVLGVESYREADTRSHPVGCAIPHFSRALAMHTQDVDGQQD